MQCEWLGERVATVDVDRAIRNVIHNKEDAGWGPNAVFRFPLEGGTGGIWKGVAKLLPQDKQVSCLAAKCVHAIVPHGWPSAKLLPVHIIVCIVVLLRLSACKE